MSYDVTDIAGLDTTLPDGSTDKVKVLDNYARDMREMVKSLYQMLFQWVSTSTLGATVNLSTLGADESPAVAQVGKIIYTGGAQTISAFAGAVSGQELTIVNNGTGALTFTHSASLRCAGGGDETVATGGGVIKFVFTSATACDQVALPKETS